MRRTILVVDSDPRTARLLRAALDPRWFAVVEAPDPISLLTLLLWIPVALVVVNPHRAGSRRVNQTVFRLVGCVRTGVQVVQMLDGVAKLATRIRTLTAGYEPSLVSQRDSRFIPSVMMPTR